MRETEGERRVVRGPAMMKSEPPPLALQSKGGQRFGADRRRTLQQQEDAGRDRGEIYCCPSPGCPMKRNAR